MRINFFSELLFWTAILEILAKTLNHCVKWIIVSNILEILAKTLNYCVKWIIVSNIPEIQAKTLNYSVKLFFPQDQEEEKDDDDDGEKDEEMKMEIIGSDANTYFAALEQEPDQAPNDLGRPAPQHKRPETPDTKKAYEALAAVGSLQIQLL